MPPFDASDSGSFSPSSDEGYFCHRSKDAYPRIFAHDERIEDVKLYACSGARIRNFYESQGTAEPQLAGIDSTSTLITLTVGGNDVGFANVLKYCFFGFLHRHCKNHYPGMKENIAKLQPRLARLYEHIGAEAPNAQIGVLGYPEIFAATAHFCIAPFGYPNRAWFHELTVTLDSTIHDAVDQAESRGVNIHYVPTLSSLSGHELCSEGSSSVNGFVKKHPAYSYHPNELGQLALAHSLEDSYASWYAAPPQPSPGPCQAALQLEQLQLFDEAKAEYVKVLEADPSQACAVSGLMALAKQQQVPEAANPCEVARMLLRLGYPDEAQKVELDQVKKDPSLECAREILQRGWPTRFVQDARSWLVTWLSVILIAIGIVLFLLVLPLVMPSEHWRRAYRQWTRRVVILRWFFKPRLAFSSFSDAGDAFSGATFQSLLGAAFVELGGAENDDELFDPILPTYELDVVSSIDDVPDVLKGVTDLNPQFGLLAGFMGFLQRILPFTRISVTGALTPSGDRGPGVELSLLDGPHVHEAIVLWERPLHAPPVTATGDTEPDPYFSLAPRAAGWLHYELASLLNDVPIDVTTSAEGYAYFRGGLAQQNGGTNEEAEGLYGAALELDPCNYAALANLGRINALKGEHEEAIRFLTEAVLARMGFCGH